jgi:hypothetical protein
VVTLGTTVLVRVALATTVIVPVLVGATVFVRVAVTMLVLVALATDVVVELTTGVTVVVTQPPPAVRLISSTEKLITPVPAALCSSKRKILLPPDWALTFTVTRV